MAVLISSKPVLRKKGERGLTLMELIVAFTIMALLTTMAVPLARYKVRRDQGARLAVLAARDSQGDRRL